MQKGRLTMTDWDPDLYLRFQMERDRPAMDLIGNIDIDRPERIIDIGCGPGNSTSLLKDRWSEAEVIGIDNSPAMIDKARGFCPEANFIVEDASRDLSAMGRFDVVFANASLQWMSCHECLVPRLFELVCPKGVLAAQIPQYDQMPISKVITGVVSSPRWAPLLQGVDPGYLFHPDASYYGWLSAESVGVRMWATEYYHVMESHWKIIEMMMSTGLKGYVERLPEEEVPEFLSSVHEGLRDIYPLQRDGRVLFPFKRLFVIACKG